MQTLVMLKGSLLVRELILMINMFIVEQRLEMFSRLILTKRYIKELVLLRNYLVLE
jgi:hypothetical protein